MNIMSGCANSQVKDYIKKLRRYILQFTVGNSLTSLIMFRAHVQKVLRDAYWKYVSNIFTFENHSSDPDTPKPEKIKKFWSFVKSL